jgi:beta-glucosidase
LSYPGDVNQYYKEDILVGYRWFDTKKIIPYLLLRREVAQPLNLQMELDKKEYSKNESLISGDVYNMGNRDGSEVVQVYVGKLNSKVKRAEKELKGFQKIEVKKRRNGLVNISIDVNSLIFMMNPFQVGI